MKSITSQLSKLAKVSDSLLSRIKIKTPQNSYLIKTNRSPTLAFLQYLTATTVFGALKTYRSIKDLVEGKKPVVKEYPKDTVIIFQFPRAYNIPSLSPFAIRVETWCRVTGIKYKSVGTTKRSSQGLIPYIQLNNIVVEDSAIIIDYLSKVYNIDLDSHLSETEKAQSRCMIKLCEQSLFPCVGLHRFWYAANGRKDIHLPLLNYWFFSYRVYTRIWNAGYGRLSPDDLYDIGRRDLSAIDKLLGEKKFFFSDSKPSNIDMIVFGISAQIKFTDRGPLNLHFITECKNLNRHVDMMRELYWPDWNENTIAFKTKPKALPSTIQK